LLLVRLFRIFDRNHLGWLALVLSLSALCFSGAQWFGMEDYDPRTRSMTSLDLFSGLLVFDNFAIFIKLFLYGFAALVVVGDGRGRVGHGAGKAREVPEAIRKATEQAKRNLIKVPLREGRTLHHDMLGHYGAGRVVLRAAAPGTGIIAGGPTRAVFEALGVHDIVAKSVGTSNPHNMIKATFAALRNVTSPRSVAQRRGKKVSDLVGAKREAEAS